MENEASLKLTPEKIRDEVRRFIVGAIINTIGDDDNFFVLGLATSIFGLRIISFVESKFGFEIEDSDLVVDNFNSIANISDFVLRKLSHNGDA